MVGIFHDKHVIFDTKDRRIIKLQRALSYFKNWKSSISSSKGFLSDKSWFDLQSMILGFMSIIKSKVARFSGLFIKTAIINQDTVENHFSQLRGANGHTATTANNPTYLMVQGTQNSVTFGQATISSESTIPVLGRAIHLQGCPKRNFSAEKTDS